MVEKLRGAGPQGETLYWFTSEEMLKVLKFIDAGAFESMSPEERVYACEQLECGEVALDPGESETDFEQNVLLPVGLKIITIGRG